MYFFGGKDKGLRELSQIGAPVPDFFTISAEEIQNILNNENALCELCNKLRFIFGTSKIAVRSSADVEDGNKQSYAGCFLSKLNVKITKVSVYEAIKQVYESAKRINFHVNMNVVFQRMIAPIIAGVCFADAYNDVEENVCAFSFVKGLANKLVDGKKKATNVFFKKQKKKIVASEFYVTGKLSDYIPYLKKIIPIVQLIINNIYSNADIEWCIDKYGNPWIVQLRPITKKLYTSTLRQNCVVASNGIVEGKAFCIDSSLASEELKKNIDDFPNGRILVSEYTDTLFMPAIKKSKAILTSEGDILSHSAIISRELGSPCLVGIKGLSKKIKTNDIITINTHKNILKVNGVNLLDGVINIDWTSVYDFSNIMEYKINRDLFLLENVWGNCILYYKSNCDNNALNNAVQFLTKKFNSKIQLSDNDKYHWYFEWKNFNNLDCFRQYYQKAQIIIGMLDVKAVRELYEEIFLVCIKLKNSLKSSNKKKEHLIINEKIVSLYFLLDMLLPRGLSVKSTYQNTFTYFKEKQSFAELLDSKIKINKDVENVRNFLLQISVEKNKIFEKFIEHGLLKYDYMQERDAEIRALFNNKYPKYSETMYKMFYKKYINTNK